MKIKICFEFCFLRGHYFFYPKNFNKLHSRKLIGPKIIRKRFNIKITLRSFYFGKER